MLINITALSEKLTAFLKKYGAYNKYLMAIEEQFGNKGISSRLENLNNIMDKTIDKNIVKLCISGGFSWNSTPEGFMYWCNLDEKWCQLVIEDGIDGATTEKFNSIW